MYAFFCPWQFRTFLKKFEEKFDLIIAKEDISFLSRLYWSNRTHGNGKLVLFSSCVTAYFSDRHFWSIHVQRLDEDDVSIGQKGVVSWKYGVWSDRTCVYFSRTAFELNSAPVWSVILNLQMAFFLSSYLLNGFLMAGLYLLRSHCFTCIMHHLPSLSIRRSKGPPLGPGSWNSSLV